MIYRKTLASIGMLMMALSSSAQDGGENLSSNDTLISKQIVKQKVVDGGGSGIFKAVAVKEKGLPDFVIYRPKNLEH